jgi:hypothetical protein
MKKHFLSLLLLSSAVTSSFSSFGMGSPTEKSTRVVGGIPVASMMHQAPSYVSQPISELSLLMMDDDLLFLEANEETPNQKKVITLIDQEASIEYKDMNGWTLLRHAAEWNNQKMVKLLAQKGASVNTKDTMLGKTPLHDAEMHKALGHDISMVELLMLLGASVNAQDFKGQTPLQYAKFKKDNAKEFLLLSYGATPTETISPIANELIQQYQQGVDVFSGVQAGILRYLISPITHIVTGYLYKNNPPLTFDQTVARNREVVNNNVRAMQQQRLAAQQSAVESDAEIQK